MIFKAEIWREERENNLDTSMQSNDDTCFTSCPVWEGKKQPLLTGDAMSPEESQISIRAGGKDRIKKLKIRRNLVVAW